MIVNHSATPRNRNEFEILQYRKVKSLREIPIQGVSEEFMTIHKMNPEQGKYKEYFALKEDLFNKRMAELSHS